MDISLLPLLPWPLITYKGTDAITYREFAQSSTKGLDF